LELSLFTLQPRSRFSSVNDNKAENKKERDAKSLMKFHISGGEDEGQARLSLSYRLSSVLSRSLPQFPNMIGGEKVAPIEIAHALFNLPITTTTRIIFPFLV
jgi:hypothetical protein